MIVTTPASLTVLPCLSSTSPATSPSLAISTPTPRRPKRTVLARAAGKFSLPALPIPPTPNKHTWLRLTHPPNRGVEGEEVQDEGFNLANARRRSNSSSYTPGLKDFKTKFEAVETEPVFEEDLHGPTEEDYEELAETHRVNTAESSESSNEDAKSA